MCITPILIHSQDVSVRRYMVTLQGGTFPLQAHDVGMKDGRLTNTTHSSRPAHDQPDTPTEERGGNDPASSSSTNHHQSALLLLVLDRLRS